MLNAKIHNQRQNSLWQKMAQFGFTLTEIVIVTALGLIFTVGLVANYLTSQKNARDSKRKHDLNVLSQNLEIYYSSVSPPAYPAGDMTELKNTLVPNYLSEEAFPTDPLSKNGQVYFYNRPTISTYYLCAYLENKKNTDPNCPAGTPSCGGGKNCNYGISQPLP